MCRTKRSRIPILTLLLLPLFSAFSAPGKDPVPGQKPLILIQDTFRFVPGSWAAYDLHDTKTQEHYQMWIAILDRTQKKVGGQKVPHCWMEIEVRLPDHPPVVTRMLARETPEGPGELASVIVQVKGMDAFSVPKRFYRPQPGDEPEAANLRPAREVKRLERRRYTQGGRSFEGWMLDALDADGKPLRAIVSEELAPIGVYRAESSGFTMQLTDWGMGAATRIQGPVYPFWLWVASQMEEAVRNPEPKP